MDPTLDSRDGRPRAPDRRRARRRRARPRDRRARASSPPSPASGCDADVAIAGGRIAGVGAYEGRRRIDARRPLPRPRLHRRPRAHRVLEADGRRVRPGRRARTGRPRSCATRTRSRTCSAPTASHWLLDACEGVPLDVFVMAPSCVPASPFESPRRPLTIGDMEAILRRRRALGVAEMMNFPAVIAGDGTSWPSSRSAHATSTATRRACAAARSTPTWRPASAPTTSRRRSRRRSRSGGGRAGC